MIIGSCIQTKIICEKENKKNSIVVIKQGSENFININFYM